MEAAEREQVEARLRALLAARDHAAAATLAIRAYGPELFGFLVGMSDEQTAADLFAATCVDLWKDLPRFRGDSSFRTWAYTVARHKLYRSRRARNRRAREVTPSQAPELAGLIEQVRTTTIGYLRTSVKDAFTALRARLDPDDQMLLVLRVDKDLEWREIAQVMGAREDALRKRFERVKARLKKLATAAGIV